MGTRIIEKGQHLDIAHVSSAHKPDDIRIYVKECRALAAAGFNVGYFVAADGQVPEDNGVVFEKVPKPQSLKQRALVTTWQIFRRVLRKKPRYVHFHDPELIPVGLALKLFGYKVIYDVHENVPATIYDKPYIPKVIRPVFATLFGGLEKFAHFWFDGVVAATPSIASRFRKSKTLLVQNFPIQNELVQQNTDYQSRPANVFYGGSIDDIRGARQIMDSLTFVKEPQVKLHLAGTFSTADLEKFHKEHSCWEKVNYHGWIDRGTMKNLLGSSRIGLVLFLPAANHIESQPNKIFEYMSAGLPIVASNFPLWKSIVETSGCGICVDPKDPQAIGNAINYLLENPQEAEEMGKKGQKAIQDSFNWELESQKLVAFYKNRVGQ